MNKILDKIRRPKRTKISNQYLHKFNLVMAALHAVQGIVVLVIAKSASLPVITAYLTTDELASAAANKPVLAQAARELFTVNLAYLVALFFFISALAHLLTATRLRKLYEKDLKKGLNRIRWIEYGFSASTMMVAIAMLSGVYELALLFCIFMLTLLMNRLGLIMEVHNQDTKRVNWLSFIVGSVAGIVPWIVVAIYLVGANAYGSGNIPTFVYWIYGSLFLFFNCFAINMYLQYKRKGKWADYVYGERVYMILSLVAKSALAWQVFAGTLRP